MIHGHWGEAERELERPSAGLGVTGIRAELAPGGGDDDRVGVVLPEEGQHPSPESSRLRRGQSNTHPRRPRWASHD